MSNYLIGSDIVGSTIWDDAAKQTAEKQQKQRDAENEAAMRASWANAWKKPAAPAAPAASTQGSNMSPFSSWEKGTKEEVPAGQAPFPTQAQAGFVTPAEVKAVERDVAEQASMSPFSPWQKETSAAAPVLTPAGRRKFLQPQVAKAGFPLWATLTLVALGGVAVIGTSAALIFKKKG